MRGKWFLVLSLAVILAAALGGVWLAMRRAVPKAAPPRAAEALTLPENGIATLSGLIEPENVLAVGAVSGGTVDAFLADVGQEVNEGDTLARISSKGLESEVESASKALERTQSLADKTEESLNAARLEESRANADLERSRLSYGAAQERWGTAQTRYRLGAISANAFAEAQKLFAAQAKEYELKQQSLRTASDYVDGLQKLVANEEKNVEEKQQALEAAKGDLNAADVIAPVSGIVVARNGAPGQVADDIGKQMFVIATDFANMQVTLDPEPPLLKRIVPGMPALVLIPELTNAALSGDVKNIEKDRVIVEFVNTLAALKPGMHASVRFKLN